MLSIIDYDAGNLHSVENALRLLGYSYNVSGDADTLSASDLLILPGVGAYESAMRRLRERHLDEVIIRHVKAGKPFLGICLGFQLLFERSEEAEEKTYAEGLGLLKGEVRRFPEEAMDPFTGTAIRIPHMGWNSLEISSPCCFEGIPNGSEAYFVHSYAVFEAEEGKVAARSEYGLPFVAAIEDGPLFACQFHPEKSGAVGLRLLRNFLERSLHA